MRSTYVLPHQGVVVRVQVSPGWDADSPLMTECREELEQDSLLKVDPDGTAKVVLTNPTGCSAVAEARTELGGAVSATVVSPGLELKSDPLPSSTSQSCAHRCRVKNDFLKWSDKCPTTSKFGWTSPKFDLPQMI